MELTAPESRNGRLNGHAADRVKNSKRAIPFRFPKADRVLYAAAAVLPWGLAVVLLAVSMPHLAAGFETITQCGAFSSWMLALAFDLTQVVCKLQLTMAKRYAVTDSTKWTSTGIIAATSLMSMALNVIAFLTGATSLTGTVLAWVAGILLPSLILALSYTGSSFALAKVKRTQKAKAKIAK